MKNRHLGLKGKQLPLYLLLRQALASVCIAERSENDDVTRFAHGDSYVIKSVVDAVATVTATKDSAVFFPWWSDRARMVGDRNCSVLDTATGEGHIQE